MNLHREDDPAQKHRDYMREYMRKKRAEEKLAKMQSAPAVTATKKVSRKRTRTVMDDPNLLPLHEWDRQGYQAGTLALNKAVEALKSIEPENLRPIDIKRLLDAGVKLRRECGPGIGTEETEEDNLFFTNEFLGNDTVIDSVNAILRETAQEELAEDNGVEK